MQKSQYTNPTEKQTSWLKSAAFDCSCSASSTLHTAQLQKLPKFYFLYNKLFSTIFNPEKHDGVITHLEPDILECEIKWALGSITVNKASGVMEFQLSYFKSWKMMLWKCCIQYASKFGKLSSGHRTGKGQFLIPVLKKGNTKECSHCHSYVLILHASKVMLKILQAKFQ